MKLALVVLASLFAAPARAADPAAVAKNVSQAVQDYVQAKSAESADGSFKVQDTATRKTLRLSLVKVRKDTVAEAGKGMYRVCADFKTAKGGSADVDFLVRGSSDGWDVKRAILHSVDGQERAAAAAAPAPAARGEFKKVNLPGYSDKQQQGMPPGAAAAAGQMPVQMPQLPPGVSIPGMGGQQQPQGNQQ